MSTAPISDIRLLSPFRKVDWRWRAVAGDAEERDFPRSWEDPWIVQLRLYLFDMERADSTEERHLAAIIHPDLFVAHAIHIAADIRRDELQARLLCEPVEVIAMKMGLPDSVVFAYAQTFFDILHCLRAMDWVLEHAIRPYSFSKPPKEGEYWRLLGYYGGVYVLETLINDYFGRANPECPDQHELADCLRFLVRYNLARPPAGRAVDPEIEDEDCRRALEQFRRTGKRIEPIDAYNLKCLRLAAGLPKSKQLQKFLPKDRSCRKKQADFELSPLGKDNLKDAASPPADATAPPVEIPDPIDLQQSKGVLSWMTDLDRLRSQPPTNQPEIDQPLHR